MIYAQRVDAPRTSFSLPEYCDYRDQNTSFEGLGAIVPTTLICPIPATPSASRACGSRPTLSAFSACDRFWGAVSSTPTIATAAPPVAMNQLRSLVSPRYGKDSAIVGRSVNLNGEPRQSSACYRELLLCQTSIRTSSFRCTGVGSAPERAQLRELSSFRWPSEIGRHAGAGLRRSSTQFGKIFARQFPEAYTGKIGNHHRSADGRIVSNVRTVLADNLLPLPGALLLIGCVNLAGISLSRAAARQRELRVPDRARRHRRSIARLSLREVILALFAVRLGLLLEIWDKRALLRLVPTDCHGSKVSPSTGSVVFASVITLIATFVAVSVPAWLLFPFRSAATRSFPADAVPPVAVCNRVCGVGCVQANRRSPPCSFPTPPPPLPKFVR